MGWGCYFWVGARRGWVGPRRGWGTRRGEACRSLKLTRGPRRGYKNVKKQPTGLSKEVRWALLEGGAGLVRGLIPFSSEHCTPLHRTLSKFVSGKVVTPRREWTGFWVWGAPGAGPGRGGGPREPQKSGGCGFLGLGTVSCLGGNQCGSSRPTTFLGRPGDGGRSSSWGCFTTEYFTHVPAVAL